MYADNIRLYCCIENNSFFNTSCRVYFNIKGESISLSRRCDTKPDCRDYSDELQCPPVQRYIVTEPTTTKSQVGSMLRFLCTAENTTIQYSVDDLCIYDTSKAVHCLHSEHLYHCTDHQCPSMFKVSTGIFNTKQKAK